MGERRARVAEKQAKVLKEEKESRPFPNNKRKAGSGKIIIGAILIIIAGAVTIALGSAKSIQETNVDDCLIEAGFANLIASVHKIG